MKTHNKSLLRKLSGLLIAPLAMSAERGYSEQALSAQQVADALQLEGHMEGGFYRRTFQADHRPMLETDHGPRYIMTSIYYMLTAQSPVGHLHRNRSDIMHYFHGGDPITYYVLDDDGQLQTYVLGPDLAAGQTFQLLVKGGLWKASTIASDGRYGYGLISEAVAPGFDYQDMVLGERDALSQQFPQHKDLIAQLTRTVSK